MENYKSHFVYAKLIVKYLKNELNMEEKAELDQWVAADFIHQQLFERLIDGRYIANELEIYASFDRDETRLRLMKQIKSKQKKIFGLSPLIMAAAAVIAIAIGIYFFDTSFHPNPSRDLVSPRYTQDIAPGKNRATLTLAGKTINLSDARTEVIIDSKKISYNDGTMISEGGTKSLTLTTPRGGTYKVSLPDGTSVWLNSASRLTYTAALIKVGSVRRVELIGEAYFQVARDKTHPFVVNSQNMELTVLGTHFNVNTYASEGLTKATLLEGSVRVAQLNRGSGGYENVILKPRQQASISSGSGIIVTEVDSSAVVAWKNGYFDFNEHLGSIMNRVAMWYDVEVQYNDESLKQIILQGKISRNRPLSEILNMMAYTSGIHFEIKGRRLIVKK